MKVLIGCEMSGMMRRAFDKLGRRAVEVWLVNARLPALHRVSMQAREVYDVRLRHGFIEVPMQRVSKLSRILQALAEKPEHQLGSNIGFPLQAAKNIASIAAGDENLLKHLKVLGFEIGGVDPGRHGVLLSVRAKLKSLNGSARSMATETVNLRSIVDDGK